MATIPIVETPRRPVHVALVNDYEIVLAGTARVLDAYSDRVRVVELDVRAPVARHVDVVLMDMFASTRGDGSDVRLGLPPMARLVVFTWHVRADLVAAAMTAGASGYVSKGCTALELVDVLERVHGGEVVLPGPEGDRFGRWPGDDFGLSARESEVLALICQGLSNKQISETVYLGINTVKTYIRTAYRKIGVTSRTQAVLFGLDHGFQSREQRILR